MAPNISSTGLVASIRFVEILNIVGLKDEHNNPIYACNDRVQGKGRVVVIVLTPDCMAVIMPLAVLRRRESVVDSCYNH